MPPEHKPHKPERSEKDKRDRGLFVVIILLLLIIIWLLIKPPLPLMPDTPRPKPKDHHEPVQEKVISGVITGFKNNPHLDVNAVELKTTTAGEMSIEFRPHTAQAVEHIGNIGQSVTIKYANHPNDEVVGHQMVFIKNDSTNRGQILADLPPPPDIPNRVAETFTLTNPALITDQYGGIVALKKRNLLFHFKPGLVDDIAPLIKQNHSFSLLAVKRDDRQGFINVDHDSVYIVISITVDNKTFLVR